MTDTPFEVYAEQALIARFRNMEDAMLFAHILLGRGLAYLRVVDTSETPVASWRIELGGGEMPLAERE